MSEYQDRIFFLICFLLSGLIAFAQPKDNAPYSRFGLGNPINQYFSSATGMGGLSATYADPLHANILNPASFGHLMSTTFEVGIFGEYSRLEGADQTQKIWSGNLNYLSLGFPVQNPLNALLERKKRRVKWGMNLAMLPYTGIGYDVRTPGEVANNDTLEVTNTFQGTGGTNRLIWSNGFKYENFSAGINLGFLFGKLERDHFVTFDNLETSFDNHFIDDIDINGFIWNLGFQYRLPLNKTELEKDENTPRKSLVIGVFGNSKTNFSTTKNTLVIAENARFGLSEQDTLVHEKDVSENGKLPAELTFGLMYEHFGKLRIGIEYGMGNWSEYVNEATGEGTPDGTPLSDSKSLAAGVEWIPDATSYNNFLERVRYRLGIFYQDDPRLDDLKNYGLSLGFGLPVIKPRQQTSFVNIAFEYGKFGISDSIQETYFRTTLGFTLNDNSWFFKRKFN